MKKHLLVQRFATLLAAIFLLTSASFAQRTLSGVITDAENNDPLIGANVVVQGTTTGTITDFDGKFTLNVPSDAENLVISYSGYTAQIISIAAGNFNIALSAGTLLDEVVMVGYGSQRSKEITSSVASVGTEDFIVGNVQSPAQLLQGKVPGLTISRVGGDPNGTVGIRLRGLSTIGANTEPLIIIDGIVGGSLSNVDPNDIEQIDVLKDGSASAIYGTRGSSGVIIITTKKGKKGASKIDYNGYVSTESIARTPDIATPAEFLAAGGIDNLQTTDWYGELSQLGIAHAHNVSLSGGTDQTTYRVSFNYRNQEGVVVNTGFDQINGGLSITQKALNDKLRVNLNYLITKRDISYGFPEAFRYATVFNPTSKIFNDDGTYNEPGGFDLFNPVAIVNQNSSTGTRNENLLGAYAEYTLIDGLSVGAQYARQNKNEFAQEFYPNDALYRGGQARNGVARRGIFDEFNNLYEGTLRYVGEAGKISYSAVGGLSYQRFENAGFGAEAGNFLLNAFESNNIGQSLELLQGQALVGSYKNANQLRAQFVRGSINYNDTYFASGSVRREESDRFGEGNTAGIFPAISVGADLAKILNIGSVDNLKLRLGYGITGNQPSQSYLANNLYSPGASFLFNGTYVPSFGPTQNANPDLKWETKGELNAGLDFALLGSKLYGSLDVFNRTTRDLILFAPVSVPPNLAPNTWQNSGSFTTNGIELGISYEVSNSENFKYVPTLIFTRARSVLDSYLENTPELFITNLGAPGQNITAAGVGLHKLEVGKPIGQIYAPEFAGVAADGSNLFVDQQTGEAVAPGDTDADDWVLVGNGLPDFELSLNNSFKFGQFDANIFLRSAIGHSLVNTNRAFYETTPEVIAANFIKTSKATEGVKTASYNSTHVEDASFLKIDNLALGYNFKMGSGKYVKNARVYLAGQNVLTFTGYTGVDPEVVFADAGSVDNGGRINNGGNPLGAFNGGGFIGGPNPLAPGVDRRNTYFATRTFTFGLQLGF